jgi:hypothetical protein
MPPFVVTVESHLESDWHGETHEIGRDLGRAVKLSAEEGAAHARENHPYTDRSSNLTLSIGGYLVEQSELGAEGEIEAKADYASYVDKGTSRSKPYPFMDEAEKVANQALERETALVALRAEERFNRR